MWSRAGTGAPALRALGVLALLAGAAALAMVGRPGHAAGASGPVLYGWGGNDHGQLAVSGELVGQPTRLPFTPACPPTAPPQCSPIAAGRTFTLALGADGSVWGWGDNRSGQLGATAQLGTLVTVPTRVPGLPGPSAKQGVGIAAGQDHSVALLRDVSSGATEVWTWGTDVAGVGLLGQGTMAAGTIAPAPVVGSGGAGKLRGMVAVAAGSFHSAALHSRDGSAADGTVWSWGDNSYGELGIGKKGQGAGGVPGSGSPLEAVGLSGATALASGGFRSVAARSDGTVWSWGEGYDGEIGDGMPTFSYTALAPRQMVGVMNATAVSTGWNHTLVLRSDGLVMGTGDDKSGELGAPCPVPQATNVNPCSTNVAILIPGIVNASHVAAGSGFSLAATGADVTAWGTDNRDQLGDGGGSIVPLRNTLHLGVASALAAGQSHALALVQPASSGAAPAGPAVAGAATISRRSA